MARADYRLQIDFDNDGSFGHAESDVSADILPGLMARRGRNYGNMIYGRSVAGSLTVNLRNDTDKYNRFNPNSPLHNLLVPQLLVRLSMRPDGATDYTSLWTGYLDRIERIERRSGNNEARLSALGIIVELSQREVSVAIQENVSTADALGLILDAAGITAAQRGTIDGNISMARWWSRDQRAIEALREVEETEGGFVYETREGAIAMQDNDDRTLSAAATYTLSDTPTGTDIPALTLEPGDPTQDITNSVTVPIRQYAVGAVEVLWTLGTIPDIEAGETIILVVQYPDEEAGQSVIAVSEWEDLVATTDYLGNTAEDGSGNNRTSSLSITATKAATTLTLEIENTHASDTIYLTHLQARGRELTAEQPVNVKAENADSIMAYGRRSYLAPAQFLSTTRDGFDYANLIVQLNKDPLTRVSGSFDATDDGDIAVALDLSQRIEVDLEGVAEDYFIENIEHRIGQGRRHIVNLLMSPASPFGSVIVLDQGPGLDEGILAR